LYLLLRRKGLGTPNVLRSSLLSDGKDIGYRLLAEGDAWDRAMPRKIVGNRGLHVRQLDLPNADSLQTPVYAAFP